MSFNEVDARKFYGVLDHHKIEYTELRGLDPITKEVKDRDYVQNEEAFITFCRRNSGKLIVWAGLNPRKEKKGTNEAIARRSTILIDIDYHHGDSGATDAEVQKAILDADLIIKQLKATGHPEPWVDMSGNGVHILINVNLPPQPDLRDKIIEFYKTLPVKTDEANADLARMVKVCGTLSLRGAPRLSYMVSPGDWNEDKILEAFLTSSETKQPTLTTLKTGKNELNKDATKRLSHYLKTMRPCIRSMLKNENEGAHGESGDLHHEAHLLIVKDAQYNGLGYPEICVLFTTQPDYNKGVTEDKVKSAIADNAQKGISPWYCNNLIKRGWCTAQDPELCATVMNDPLEAKNKAPREDPMDKALESLSTYYFKTPEDVESLYLFKEGEYRQGEPFVKATLETLFGNKNNTGLCGEVINHLKRRSYVPREVFNKFDGWIPVLNGLLNLNTGTQMNFTPEKVFTFKIQAKYDKSKRSEKWINFLEEVLPDELDRLALQEYAGSTLYPRMPFHKLAFLVGSGRNGKGVFVRTLQGILGIDNVSNIRLDQLNGGNRFAATNLYGKLMNVSSEPSTRWPLQTELLKQLTGEDWVDGEIKGKQNPVRFQPFAKHFVLANKLPKVNDTSIGWWDRVLIIIWEQTFTEENGKQVVNLEDAWLNNEDDRSGILNWLIEGWNRLSAKGRFTQSKTQKEAMIQFKRASDPIAAFLTEECEYAPDYYMLRDAFYDAYKDYAKSLNTTPEGTKVFWEYIRKEPGIDITHKKRVEGKAQRVVSGVKIKGDVDADTLEDFNESESEAREAPEAGQVTRQKSNEEEESKRGGVETPASGASSASPKQEEPPKCEVCGEPGSFSYQGRRLCKKHLDEMIKQDGKMF